MQKKEQTRRTILDALKDVSEGLGTVVGERWWVEEFRPAYNTGGYYDQDISEQVIERSQYFSDQDEAWNYFEEMEPGESEHRLRLRHQKCYERLERRWI